jgi:hypothetical protein
VSAVSITHGRKYHTNPDCPRMTSGEDLHDFEGDSDYGGGFTAGTYRRTDTATYAAACGKLPCLYCVPAEQCLFPPLYGNHFGHRPEWADVGSCGLVGCWCPQHEDRLVCARCVVRRYESSWVSCFGADGDEHRVYGSWLVELKRVPWPCTTAVVLGLAERDGGEQR